jgi:hypothetical protein
MLDDWRWALSIASSEGRPAPCFSSATMALGQVDPATPTRWPASDLKAIPSAASACWIASAAARENLRPSYSQIVSSRSRGMVQ